MKAEMKSNPWLCLHIGPTFITNAIVFKEKKPTNLLNLLWIVLFPSPMDIAMIGTNQNICAICYVTWVRELF